MKFPPMIPIESSSNIIAVGYEPADRYLFIQFKSGTYRYEDVPPTLHAEMMEAESKGKFVGAEIKGKFQSMKLDIEVMDETGVPPVE